MMTEAVARVLPVRKAKALDGEAIYCCKCARNN
jgi:hypothetical protein